MLYLVYLTSLTFLILSYFRIAQHFNIIDAPNHRSSHLFQTIRGGGIIFPIGILLVFFEGAAYLYFTIGLFFISVVSFYDDISPLSSRFRLICHLGAASLLFFETGFWNQQIWIILGGYILAIGIVNAYNFMDGINGSVAAYSLVTVLSLGYINEYITQFILSEWLIVCCISLLVFSFFNFRTKAKCFAGDVGSVSMAFIILFFIMMLVLKTGEIKYVGLLLIYGLDTISTIVFRLVRQENIFQAHRTHFYQYLVNIKLWPHLVVSSLYAILQLILNVFIIGYSFSTAQAIFSAIIFGILLVCLRFGVEGKEYLTRRKNSTSA